MSEDHGALVEMQKQSAENNQKLDYYRLVYSVMAGLDPSNMRDRQALEIIAHSASRSVTGFSSSKTETPNNVQKIELNVGGPKVVLVFKYNKYVEERSMGTLVALLDKGRLIDFVFKESDIDLQHHMTTIEFEASNKPMVVFECKGNRQSDNNKEHWFVVYPITENGFGKESIEPHLLPR